MDESQAADVTQVSLRDAVLVVPNTLSCVVSPWGFAARALPFVLRVSDVQSVLREADRVNVFADPILICVSTSALPSATSPPNLESCCF
jgi:hypothetical protein